MTDQPGRDSFTSDISSISLDDDDQLEPEDTLIEGDEGGAAPYTPPDNMPRNTEWGTTAWEESQEETIEQRIMQEEPETNSAYGAPGEPDADPEADREMVGQLIESDEGVRPDSDAELFARADGSGEGPEQGAMRVVDEDDLAGGVF